MAKKKRGQNSHFFLRPISFSYFVYIGTEPKKTQRKQKKKKKNRERRREREKGRAFWVSLREDL